LRIGIIVVSASYETSGTILHINDMAKMMLEIDENMLDVDP
jgi:hypothetical protein